MTGIFATLPQGRRMSGFELRRAAQDFASCVRGSPSVEFGLIAPSFLFMLATLNSIGQMAYGQAVLNGAVYEAARTSTLEGGSTTIADGKVTSMVRGVLPGATILTSRVSYNDFADIGRAEKWNDINTNGTCDNNETYTDENGSGEWEADIGVSGNGGANDVIVYAVSITYEPVFRIPFVNTVQGNPVLASTTVKKNQPYANQESYGTGTGVC